MFRRGTRASCQILAEIMSTAASSRRRDELEGVGHGSLSRVAPTDDANPLSTISGNDVGSCLQTGRMIKIYDWCWSASTIQTAKEKAMGPIIQKTSNLLAARRPTRGDIMPSSTLNVACTTSFHFPCKKGAHHRGSRRVADRSL